MRVCKFIGHIKIVVLFSLKNFHGAFCRFIQYFIITTFYLTLFLKIFCQFSSVLTFFLSFYVTIHPWMLTVVALNFFFVFFGNIIFIEISYSLVQSLERFSNALFQLKLDIVFLIFSEFALLTNANLTKTNIVMAFFKNRDINFMFRTYICISTRYKIDT